MADGRHFEKKLQYLSNGLTDLHKNVHNDARWPFLPYAQLQIPVFNKGSAVAEMGDRGHNMGRKEGGLLCFFRGGELGPHLTQCGLG